MARLRPELVSFVGGPAGCLSLGFATTSPPVVLIHGFAGDSLTWQLNLGALSSHWRVIAIDLPGHGRSTRVLPSGKISDIADWIDCALEALAIPTCHLVGHSMGGWVALDLAKRQPKRVLSATVISCGGLSNGFDVSFLQKISSLESYEQALDCARVLFGKSQLFIEGVARGLLASSTNAHLLNAIIDESFLPGLTETPLIPWSEIAAPVQFIWGEDDVVIPPPSLDRLPHNPFYYKLKDVGHLPHLEAAEDVNRKIIRFIEGS